MESTEIGTWYRVGGMWVLIILIHITKMKTTILSRLHELLVDWFLLPRWMLYKWPSIHLSVFCPSPWVSVANHFPVIILLCNWIFTLRKHRLLHWLIGKGKSFLALFFPSMSSESHIWFVCRVHAKIVVHLQMGGESLQATQSKPRRLLKFDIQHELMKAKTK